ncbi:MAG: iron-regulated protein [Bacteroidetes bacterium]|nr:MAG: iron-regulated protein [Bacteroidota bacterium]
MKTKSLIILISLFSFILLSFKNDKPAYQMFDKQGNQIVYSEMINKIKDADIVFFGELHDNPISHWMEKQVTIDLYQQRKADLLLGAEMFESDNQLILDEYLSGYSNTKTFEAEARLWPNYKTDYKPLIEFAKNNKLKFIATNIPRRYASLVHKKGFEGITKLSAEAKKYIAPTPINYDENLNCYKQMMNMGGAMKSHVNKNFPMAQAAKDATMAHFILQNWKKGKLFIHYNGSYHSDNYEGIVWHLKQQNKNLNIVTITTVLQKNIDVLEDENKNTADFIFCVPEDMTRTY